MTKHLLCRLLAFSLQFDYPVHRLKPLTGSTTLKIAPGARTGMFKTVGGLDAHTCKIEFSLNKCMTRYHL